MSKRFGRNQKKQTKKKEVSLHLKKKNGRPSEYKEDYARQAHVVCSEMGATDLKLAKLFGVTRPTISQWKQDHPEFKKAIVEGKDIFNSATAETCLLKRVTGYDFKETTLEPDIEGKLSVSKIVKKHIPSDPTSTIFFLKNRNPERWRDTKNIDAKIEGDVDINVTLKGMDDD